MKKKKDLVRPKSKSKSKDDIWTTADGRKVFFCDIDDEHLRNIFGSYFKEVLGLSVHEIYERVPLGLIQELDKRNIGSIEDIIADKGIENRIKRKGW